MNKSVMGLMPLALLIAVSLNAYTFKICYNGGREGAVDVPSQIDVSTVIHGGSMCFTPLFAIMALASNSSQTYEVTPSSGDWSWCRIVPETVNDAGTIKSISGNWLMPDQVPPTDEGQTWQIQKMPDVTYTYSDPMTGRQYTITLSWDGFVQDGIQDCNMDPLYPEYPEQ